VSRLCVTLTGNQMQEYSWEFHSFLILLRDCGVPYQYGTADTGGYMAKSFVVLDDNPGAPLA